MSSPDFKQNYFELFDLPQAFDIDSQLLGERYRKLQGDLHPDRFASAAAHERRLAIQYSALVNEAYAALKAPLPRAEYLLKLAGLSPQEISAQRIDGGFLMEQMELREKLETLPDLVDPETALDHLVAEISADLRAHQAEFEAAYVAGDNAAAAAACVKMQYLDKLLREAEQVESDLLDS
ncbi:Fe-S protein assembly co-chaperone HscB [Mangrovimicrobium sediminis]|uniref:Co-chaperone protein HscB homolog n=1 Tax=Mangrovimicrobium sediminis TaxID=2562682 RepID=A0A4Z0M3J5_9GAMM|nr:Fe-S protein assembly co-chaperone HscB [Haliea sp. SAOS-164]TGD73938.1 Fe-S protein assembly co-chaperone HscB [Haliea sp. SAOS-164]